METSQTISKIAEALAKVQGQMKPAGFDASNPHFKSKYATLAAVMESCRQLLSAHGIAILQGTSVENDPLRVSVQTQLVHVSGEWIKETLSIRPVRDDAQSIGSAITYARRYGLSAMVGIVSDDDDDGEAAVGRQNNQPEPVPGNVRKLTAVKKTVKSETAKVDPPKPEPVMPATEKAYINKVPAKPNLDNPKTSVQDRIAKIREIFTFSAKLGQKPDQMKAAIGQILGLNRPIRESAEITNDRIDDVLEAFRADYLERFGNEGKEKAA
ncbi:MAG TPA: ERF family protein [Candidatus Ozemobacteraceae bacterium]|nr:ERF family protein [Candidatus Ozemobacteraceae bacterium]